MYGLINQAMQELVSRRFGPEAWEEVRRRCGVVEEEFSAMEAYPDKLTYDLIAAAGQVLNKRPGEVLEAFGEFWVGFAEEVGFSELMAAGGTSFPEFLSNLDRIHSLVQYACPNLVPPRFEVLERRSNYLEVHYFSLREALVPAVVGLLRGLGKRFSTQLEIQHERAATSDGRFETHEIFRVRYLCVSPGRA